jgi:hypothetical protein
MLWHSHRLRKAWRFAKRGPQLAGPGRDHGGPSKPYKVSSPHAILIPAAKVTIQTSALMSKADIKNSLDHFHINANSSVDDISGRSGVVNNTDLNRIIGTRMLPSVRDLRYSA